MKRSIRRLMAILMLSAVFSCSAIFLVPEMAVRADSMNGSMNAKDETPSKKTQAAEPALEPGIIPATGFVIEGFLGGDTSLSGSYATTTGETVPYDFGTAPVWGIRAGKMLFPSLLAYLTVQQSDFSQNTHTIIGLGGNYYLPRIPGTHLLPYLNATFGASYNTYTGVNAQAGYSWMLGTGALYPLSPAMGVFLEADISYETAPTGITTSLGTPPGNVSQVSDTWSVPLILGIRYAF